MAKIRGFILGFLVWLIYKIISMTWRVHVVEPASMQKSLQEKKSLILSHFHGDEIALISLVPRYQIATMTSTSKDGEIMNTVLALLGAKTSRGSSTRGGVSALKGLLSLMKRGHNCSFAVDGPKGPLHKVKPGVFETSRLTKSKIFAGGVAVDRAWYFPKSWNKTYFPKPFARVVFYWLDPEITVDKDTDPRDPNLAKVLENQLIDAHRLARKLIADQSSRH